MIADVLSEATERMGKSVDAAKADFSEVRTGRANPSLFSRVLVDYYGSPTPLQQLASLQVPEARVILIQPFDKTALKEIEKAIVARPDLGVTPNNDGNIIRIVMPELTEERRREYVKVVRGKAEEARVSVRNIRRRAKDDLDALDGVGEDEVARAEKELDGLTKRHVDQIDEALARKEAELLEV